MRVGFVTAITGDWSFTETLALARGNGYDCVEVACWPAQQQAERRYAGVCHIDTAALTDAGAREIIAECEKSGVTISSLAYYPNTMDGDPAARERACDHLRSVMEASRKLGVNMVTTFIGRDQTKTTEENIDIFRGVWPALIREAESLGVRVAIENCPMLFGAEQWPGGQNLFTSPRIWRRLFEIIPSDHFGINYDPSHFVWQMMDYIAPIYQFSSKIFHVHFKDIKLNRQLLNDVGTLAYPLEYMSPKLPGLGDVDWGAFISALNDIGYSGSACVEVEDRAYEGSREAILQSLALSRRYLSQYI